jgi:hypothetical protein
VSAGVGRESGKGNKKVSGKAYVNALNEALSARLVARAALSGVQEDLEASTDGSKVSAEREVSVALDTDERRGG